LTESTAQSLHRNDLFSLEGKVALVTGGSRGIGFMIASGFVENGVKVYITARKAEACIAAAAELSKNGSGIAIPADVATNEGRKLLLDELTEREDKLDILVNNAGASWGAPLDEYPEDGWDKVMDVNVKAPFMLTRSLASLLASAGSAEDPARVINIGSIDGLQVPTLDNFAYGPSKAAVHHLTRVLAMALASRHITVNAIAPGPFESKMTEWMLENFQRQIEAGAPMKRIGRPEDMAGVAVYLASKAGAFVTGVVIPVDGGISTGQTAPQMPAT
jgi:NAD(P)-dependent dehydrogenase (short-subunit alcohol dehydrogenase family)